MLSFQESWTIKNGDYIWCVCLVRAVSYYIPGSKYMYMAG